MKKLMTMIAAVAMSFGLFADLPTGTGFDDLAVGALTTGGDSGWADWTAGDGNFATVTAWNGSGEVYTGARPTVPGQTSQSQAVNFLNLKTTFGNPLFRNADTAAVTLNEKLYFDSLVKFTACDEDPTTEYEAGTKLIVYVKEMTSNDGETVTGTNLFVKAGKWVSGQLQSAIYDCGSFDSTTYGAADDWNRLTIKVFNNVYNNMNAGFEIFVNEIAVTHGGETGYVAANLTADAKILNSAGKLFPSMAAANYDSTIAGVGFDGQGLIDDVVFTKTAPEFADDKYFTLNWDKHVATVSYSVNGAAAVDAGVTLGTAGFVAIPYSSGMTVAVTATYGSTVQGETWAAGTWNKDPADVALDGTTFTVSAPSKNGYIVSKETTPRISVTIGQTTTTYPTFAAMLDAIKTISTGMVKIQLADGFDFTLKDETENAIITAGAEVELDLNGRTITGPEGVELAAIMSSANLTIKDSVGTGTIELGSGNTGAVLCLGKLTVLGGTFNGLVNATTSDIVAGKFARASNTNFKTELTKNADSEYDDSDQTYWIVKVATKYSLSVTGVANATFTIDGQKVESVDLKAGASYRVVATAAANYEYKADGEYPPGWNYSEGTLVNAGTMGAAPLALSVPAPTAIEWTITYLENDEKTEFATDTYTIANRGTKELNAGTREGYDFVEWLDKEDDYLPVTSLAEKTGSLTLVGSWNEASYNITYLGLEVGDTNPNEETYTYGTGLTLQDATTTRAVTFLGWFDAATGGNRVTAISKTQTGAVTLYAQWESAGKPAPDEPKTYPTAEDAENATKAFNNADNTTKATMMTIPEAAEAEKAAYAGLFTAVQGGTDNKDVTFVLSETGKEAIETAIEASETSILTTAAGGTAKIVGKPGIYYGLKAVANLEGIDAATAGQWKQAPANGEVGFTITKPSTDKGFYQVQYSASKQQ